MIISESKFRQIIRNELLRENVNARHKWVKIDDHLGFCKIYADMRSDPPEVDTVGLGLDPREDGQPIPSRCFKIEFDLDDRYDIFYNEVLEMIESMENDIKMLDSCNLSQREICIELLCDKEQCDEKLNSLKEVIVRKAESLNLLQTN